MTENGVTTTPNGDGEREDRPRGRLVEVRWCAWSRPALAFELVGGPEPTYTVLPRHVLSRSMLRKRAAERGLTHDVRTFHHPDELDTYLLYVLVAVAAAEGLDAARDAVDDALGRTPSDTAAAEALGVAPIRYVQPAPVGVLTTLTLTDFRELTEWAHRVLDAVEERRTAATPAATADALSAVLAENREERTKLAARLTIRRWFQLGEPEDAPVDDSDEEWVRSEERRLDRREAALAARLEELTELEESAHAAVEELARRAREAREVEAQALAAVRDLSAAGNRVALRLERAAEAGGA